MGATSPQEEEPHHIGSQVAKGPLPETLLKIFTIQGPEFEEDEGKLAIIVRSLYGLKSAGARFNNHLADCMRMLGYDRHVVILGT